MFNFVWPIVLVILSNIVYQICAKSVPEGINPFASLTITYFIGAIASALLFFMLGNDDNLLKEYSKLNWAPFVLGIVIVGLEVGWKWAGSMHIKRGGRSVQGSSYRVLFWQ